jgi:TonB family protein
MPISLALNALSPGGIHLAATAARNQAPKPPRPNTVQTASVAPSSVDRIAAEGEVGTGAEVVLADAGSVIAGMPEGAQDRIPAGARENPYYAGFARVCDPALIESSRIPPSYPELARQAGVHGKVLLDAMIRKDGTVGNISVLDSTAARLGFEEAAVKAVSRWRYKPGLQDGRPVEAQITILVDFSPSH